MIYFGLKINIFEDELLFAVQEAFLNAYIWIRNRELFSMLSHHHCRWERGKRLRWILFLKAQQCLLVDDIRNCVKS